MVKRVSISLSFLIENKFDGKIISVFNLEQKISLLSLPTFFCTFSPLFVFHFYSIIFIGKKTKWEIDLLLHEVVGYVKHFIHRILITNVCHFFVEAYKRFPLNEYGEWNMILFVMSQHFLDMNVNVSHIRTRLRFLWESHRFI